MFDSIEAFHRPRSVREALRLLHNGGGRARFVAGATDLIPQGDRTIRTLVDITGLGLNYIRRKGSGRVIGATCTLAALEESPAIRTLAGGILVQACAACGSVQIRNRATLGGRLTHGSSSADLAAVLAALDAAVVLADSQRRREVPFPDLISAPGRCLLLEVLIPAPPRGTAWSFQRLGRTESDVSLVSVAAGLQIGAQGVIRRARIVLGAVSPEPVRAFAAEGFLSGNRPEPELLARAGEVAAREVNPTTDIRASADYRREMCRVLVARALRECAARAGYPL